ncbi:F0F1 ATP synthase subunit gamma [Alphaproteobacteria bacterium HT1-32]|nr:F0F1 ATP synthase subunit gamma [Alphaproteobacteria bacterium HT1-32]
MANLKDLRARINSVKSTQKITSAMKMVAAAKLRRAQEGAEAARPYAVRMDRMLGSLAGSFDGVEGAPGLLAGTGDDKVQLLVAFTGDRGLCGAFNGSIIRETTRLANQLKADGKTVKILCVGRKGHDILKRRFPNDLAGVISGLGRRVVVYSEAVQVADKIVEMFEAGEFDVCTVVFNRFKSAISQIITRQQLIPFTGTEAEEAEEASPATASGAIYTYEPDETEILEELLPRNIRTQVFQALLESSASEHGARMTAMDNATRNAGDMIDGLTMTYNRTRQAVITKELIEIISGAEAL